MSIDRKGADGNDAKLSLEVPDDENLLRMIHKTRIQSAPRFRKLPQVLRVESGISYRLRFLLPDTKKWFCRRAQHHITGFKSVICPSIDDPEKFDCPVCDAIKRLSVDASDDGLNFLRQARTRYHWLTWVKAEGWTDEKGQWVDGCLTLCPSKLWLSAIAFKQLATIIQSGFERGVPLNIFDRKKGALVVATRRSASESISLTCNFESVPLYPDDNHFNDRYDAIIQQVQWPDINASDLDELSRYANALEYRFNLM